MNSSFVLGVMAALLVAGCSASQQSPAVLAPSTGSISGFVVDEALRGISGANVTLNGNLTTTDLNGAFAFGNLTPGSYVVAAQAATYMDRQTTAEVQAGNATDVRIVLPINASALAFHQVFTFKGFVDMHGGSNSPDLGECQCDFTVPTEGNWNTIIVEAKWQDTASPIVFETEYAWRITSGTSAVNGTGTAPLLGRVDTGAIEPGSAVEIRVAPHSDWIYTNQQFDVAVSVWYGEPAPPGFRLMDS